MQCLRQVTLGLHLRVSGDVLDLPVETVHDQDEIQIDH